MNLYKMVKCSNEQSVGMSAVGKEASLIIKDRFYFGSLVSSPIKEVTEKDDLILIETKNTSYTFQKKGE